MKILLGLTALFFTLALCQGACFHSEIKQEMMDGKPVKPTKCNDPYDGKEHRIYSRWNTANCMKCSCSESEVVCCTRYGGIVRIPGCKAVVNPETCQYEFVDEEYPSKPCSKLDKSLLS